MINENPKLSGLVCKLQWRHQISSQVSKILLNPLKIQNPLNSLLKIALEKHQFYYKHSIMYVSCKTVRDYVVKKKIAQTYISY